MEHPGYKYTVYWMDDREPEAFYADRREHDPDASVVNFFRMGPPTQGEYVYRSIPFTEIEHIGVEDAVPVEDAEPHEGKPETPGCEDA